MMRREPPRLVLLISVLLLAGCGGKQSGNEPAARNAASAASGSGAAAVPAVSPYDSGPRAAEAPVDGALAEKGEKVFQAKGCSACHAFGKKLSGPDLDGVATRRTARWIENQILHPEAMTKQDPIARELFAKHSLQMPNQGLTPDEARAVIEYLKHENKDTGGSDE